MCISEEMRKVISRIHRFRLNPDFISPNLVAEIAYEMGIHLTSEQVVYISDNFK